MINWELSKEVFGDGVSDMIVGAKPEAYSDDIPAANRQFGQVFLKMIKFTTIAHVKDFWTVELFHGPSFARSWSNERERIEHWFIRTSDEHGYGVIYSDNEDYLIVGNVGSHPFVLTKYFQFYNSDGSTNEDLSVDPDMSLSEVILRSIQNAMDYVNDPSH